MAYLSHQEVVELVAVVRAGDGVAFDRLVAAYSQALAGKIRALAGGPIADADVDEILQKTWVAVWRDLGRSQAGSGGFDPSHGTLFTWICARYLRFHVMQYRRERGRLAEMLPLDASNDPADGRAAPPPQEFIRQYEVAERKVVHSELFRLVFAYGGDPHQKLSFGYAKLIWGRVSPRGIEASAKRVDDEHGGDPQGVVAERFWRDYQQAGHLALEEAGGLEPHLQPLHEQLTQTVDQLTQSNPSLRQIMRDKLSQRVKQTALRDYYGRRSASQAIPDWCYKLEQRVRRAIGEQSARLVADAADCGLASTG